MKFGNFWTDSDLEKTSFDYFPTAKLEQPEFFNLGAGTLLKQAKRLFTILSGTHTVLTSHLRLQAATLKSLAENKMRVELDKPDIFHG